jgi:hypothetical protein
MGRKKAPQKAVFEQSVKELLARHDVNPIEELIKIAQELIELREGDEQYIDALMDDYELIPKDGKRYLRPKLKHRINVHSELAQYCAPKLRSTETKGQIDYNFNISIKRFEDVPETKQIEVVDVTPKQLAE